MEDKRLKATARLLEVMNTLRRECPWDREQTFESLRNNTIEETYELVDAITDGNMEGIKEELGDLLLHVVFYSKLGEEAGAFDFAEVADALCDKLIYRHPHVYGEIHADTPDEVKENWEALKLRKKNRKSGTLGGVPRSLPAMVKAYRMGEKAASAGFDWQKKENVWEKVKEEIAEVEAELKAGACSGGDPEGGLKAEAGAGSKDGADPEGKQNVGVGAGSKGELKAGAGAGVASEGELKAGVGADPKGEQKAGADPEGEFGDLFFALINACRLYGVDPESALARTNKKFIRRFEYMEERAAAQGHTLHELPLERMEELWQEAKGGE